MAAAMFGEVLNIHVFGQYLLQKPVKVRFQQDNDAALKILKNGYSARLRRTNRVHRMDWWAKL